ncbi:MAG: prolyl oligopeptidase family serine peptidase [Thermoleophilia bacterium]|nr:prolyl oligopeptidase family serine peptidase [Thermoleophilia bacterium]
MSLVLWEQRFRAPVSFLPEWSPQAPDHIVYASNESGTWQLHVWNIATDTWRQVTDHTVGLLDGTPALDGEGILWFQDDTGDESGRWLIQPFHGGEAQALLEGAPDGWNEGLAQAPGIVVAGISNRDGFAVYASLDGGQARLLARSAESLRIGSVDVGGFLLGGLSADGSLLCLEHAEHGDLLHTALRVLDPRTGSTVGEQLDEGTSIVAKCWSPIPGDQRLAFDHDREGDEMPGLWSLSTGERQDLAVDLEGAVHVQDWWPDGSALLLQNRFQGRDRLYRYELPTGALVAISTDPGVIWKARVRPDGRVWLLHEQGHRRRLVLDDEGVEVLAPQGGLSLGAHRYTSWQFANEHGQEVHGFVVTPDESGGPFPIVMFVHGGPTWLDLDRWQPEVQAYVDAGFAVGLVNYRGSIGYGREWRDALIGDIGGPELEDVNAGLRDLVERGIADPTRAVIAGYSWGGYVTLLELGKHPGLWICGVAGVPVGDYEDGYEELSPLLQEYDRALLGGHEPKDVPELMRERNPINFTDAVRVPVLFLIGRNDSRCPYRQAMAYVEKLAEREHPHEVYVYETGHSSFEVEERVRQVGTILDFLARHVPGVARPS